MDKKLIENYKDFLTNGKTERECVNQIVELAEKKGYKNCVFCSSRCLRHPSGDPGHQLQRHAAAHL